MRRTTAGQGTRTCHMAVHTRAPGHGLLLLLELRQLGGRHLSGLLPVDHTRDYSGHRQVCTCTRGGGGGGPGNLEQHYNQVHACTVVSLPAGADIMQCAQSHIQQGHAGMNDDCMPESHAISQSASAESMRCLPEPACRTRLAGMQLMLRRCASSWQSIMS